MRQEPEWWARAREMRARNLTLNQIKRILKKRDHTSVLYAVDAEFREKSRAAGRKRWHERDRTARKPPHLPRQRVVTKARNLARDTGRNPDDILREWGELPRWSRARP